MYRLKNMYNVLHLEYNCKNKILIKSKLHTKEDIEKETKEKHEKYK